MEMDLSKKKKSQVMKLELLNHVWLMYKIVFLNYKKSKLDGSLPNAKLELEFVHGYRCHDTLNNLRYTKNGNFVYHTVAVGIVYNKEDHSQLIFNEHFDDITSLALHPNKKYVATGEIGPYPLISVLGTETGKLKYEFVNPCKKV